MADQRAKAMTILRSCRVTIRKALPQNGGLQRVEADVASSRPHVNPHVVDMWSPGAWACTCQGDSAERCPHILAVQMVTGFATAGDGRS